MAVGCELGCCGVAGRRQGNGAPANTAVLLLARIAPSWAMADFKKLLVWQRAHEFALKVHAAARQMRGPQHAALRNQLVRAAMSIPTNIVEGRGQLSERHFVRFLGYALNSASETEYHLILSRDTSALPEPLCLSLLGDVIEIRRMLHGLIARVSAEKNERR